MNLSPAAAQAALDYAEELAATGLSSEQYDHSSDTVLDPAMGSRLIFFCLITPVTVVAELTHGILKTLRKEPQ